MNIADDLQRAYWDGYEDGRKAEWISVECYEEFINFLEK
jgi:hypothetical protein